MNSSTTESSKKILGWLSTHLLKRYAQGLMRRMFHPKMHGFLKATLTVETNLPADMQVGIFQPNRTYPCWLRVSSTNTKMKPDIKGNFRGFVLKVLLDDKQAQDFFTVNTPTFQAKDVKMLRYVMHAVAGNLWHKLVFLFRYFFRFLRSLKKKPICYNLLETRFWSQTPYRLGDKEIKYSFVPHKKPETPKPVNPSPDFLREQLVADLGKNEAFFDLMIQFRTNADMSIEDSSVAWDSHWHKVATVRIFRQDFDTEARRTLGENITFTPWEGLPVHEPLGELNLVRKKVYEGVQKLRHTQNHVQYVPPTPASWEQTP